MAVAVSSHNKRNYDRIVAEMKSVREEVTSLVARRMDLYIKDRYLPKIYSFAYHTYYDRSKLNVNRIDILIENINVGMNHEATCNY